MRKVLFLVLGNELIFWLMKVQWYFEKYSVCDFCFWLCFKQSENLSNFFYGWKWLCDLIWTTCFWTVFSCLVVYCWGHPWTHIRKSTSSQHFKFTRNIETSTRTTQKSRRTLGMLFFLLIQIVIMRMNHTVLK